MWNNFGAAPQATEAEVTLIGPGFGESVVIHLGSGEWMVVDSCVDRALTGRHSAPLQYLRSLGVDASSAVRLIVVSHWDDDHIRGIATLVDACPSARVCFSTSFTEREFSQFIETVSIGTAATDGANVSELRRVLNILGARNQPIVRATPGRTLLSTPHVRTWSPSDADAQEFLRFLAQSRPRGGEPLRRVVPGTPNLTSVVVSVHWEDQAILLGADMENHSDVNKGWGAIVREARLLEFEKAHLVKVPHHGSHTGHDDRMWNELLHPLPISKIAPFGRGREDRRPPKPEDVRRIFRLSSRLFITAQRSAEQPSKLDRSVVRSLREGNIKFTPKVPIGLVQSRRQPGADWRHTLFGTAVAPKI